MSVSEEKYRQLMEAYSQLSEEDQKAMTVLVANYDLIKQICLAKKYTNEERERMIEEALARKDSFRLALVCFEHVVNGD